MTLVGVAAAAACAAPALPIPASAPDPSAFDAGADNRLGLTFTPDGKTAYWVEWDGAWGRREQSPRVIHVSHRQAGGWSTPVPAAFTGGYSDDDPFVAPDGEWLYFVSDRPGPDETAAGDTNIWRYRLGGNGRPEYLGINSDAAEYSPVVTARGALYFASARAGGPGEGDLYVAAARGNGFAPPQPLGPAINSATGEWNLWVSVDDTEMIFEASSRPTNVSVPGDLYYSLRTENGWTAAVPIESLNTGGSDLLARLHPDGETLYYATAPIGGHARIRIADWPAIRATLRPAGPF